MRGYVARMKWQVVDCRRGATAVEYSLILALIVLAMMTTLRLFASEVLRMWNDVAGAVIAAVGF